MGSCMSSSPKQERTEHAPFQRSYRRYSVCPKEIEVLKLIYEDLAQRTVERQLNLENFLLFFHKNGFWGERLFK